MQYPSLDTVGTNFGRLCPKTNVFDSTLHIILHSNNSVSGATCIETWQYFPGDQRKDGIVSLDSY